MVFGSSELNTESNMREEREVPNYWAVESDELLKKLDTSSGGLTSVVAHWVGSGKSSVLPILGRSGVSGSGVSSPEECRT